MRQVLFNHPIFQQYSFKNSQFRYRLLVKSRHSAQNGAVGGGDIQIAKGIFSVDVLHLLSDVKFRWARGASARGEPKEDRGKVRELTFPLSPLGFPLALPFPDSLTPLGRKPLD